MAPRSKPPFRADHVGSLLRSPAVLEARRKFESKQISADELRRIEDDAIRHVIKRQEEAGLQSVTDGELRRGTWHMDFLCRIGGVVAAGTQLRPFRNESGEVQNEIVVPKVVDRLWLQTMSRSIAPAEQYHGRADWKRVCRRRGARGDGRDCGAGSTDDVRLTSKSGARADIA